MNVVSCALVLVSALGGSQEAPREGSWSSAPSLKFARAAHAVVASPSEIYALGGTGASGKPVLEVERFDGKGWSVVTKLPAEGLNAPAAALLDDRIFLIGGFGTTSNVPVAEVRVLDTKTLEWSSAPSLPRPRGGHAAAVLEGRIHVIGGGNTESTIADHSVFDPIAGKWKELAPLPRSMGSPAAVVHAGTLYSVGGRSGGEDFGDVYRYDAAKDHWEKCPSIEPRGTAGAVSYDGAICVFGGESQAKPATIAESLRWAPGANEWKAMPPMPTARNFARAVLFDGAVYVVGGSREPGSSHSSSGSDVVEKFRAP
jgi:N-acetylneuraminic acid mutarotase